MASSFPFSPPAISEDDDPTSGILGNKIMIAAIITLFCVICFVLLLHLYVRWLWWRIPASHRQYYYHGRRRRVHSLIRFDEDLNHGGSPCENTVGLDKETIENLPTFTYTKHMMKKDFRLGQQEEKGNDEQSVGLDVVDECAVCISEFQENEQGRMLPLCRHSFHTECIDMWLYSHSTCPLCRTSVTLVSPTPTPPAQVLLVHEHEAHLEEDSHGMDMPTNFAFWAPPPVPDFLAPPRTSPSPISPSNVTTPWPSQLSPRVATSCPSPLSPSTTTPCSSSFSHGVIPSGLSYGVATSRSFQSSRPPPIARRSLSHIRIDVPSSPQSISVSSCQSPRLEQGASPHPIRSPIRSPRIRMAIKRMLSGQPSKEKDVCGCSHDHEQGLENMAMKDQTSTSQAFTTLHND